MVNTVVPKLFNSIISATVTLYWFAILYSVSPAFTVYTIPSDGCGGTFTSSLIINFWPIVKVLDVRLFIDFNSSTEILNCLAILYNVSPDTLFM